MHPTDATIEHLAKGLASNAGQLWEQLANHPGYIRNYWREQARSLLLPLQFGGPDRPDGHR